jgi:hypothetical protein
MVTGAAAIGSILGEEGLKKSIYLVPGFIEIWLIFLGYNFHQTYGLKKYIEQIRVDITNIPKLREEDEPGGKYQVGMSVVLIIGLIVIFGYFFLYGGKQVLDQAGWFIGFYASILTAILITLGLFLLHDLCLWPMSNTKGCKKKEEKRKKIKEKNDS